MNEPSVERLRLERDLYARLLELGTREDLRPLLEGALSLIVEVTGAKKGTLALDASDVARPTVSIVHGFTDSELAAAKTAMSTGIIAEALATGRTISTASALADPRFRDLKSVQARRIQAVLCAPIGNPSIGVVYLEGRAKPGPFPEEDRAHAELFARHLYTLADRLLAREERATTTDYTAPLRARLTLDGIAGRSRALAKALELMVVASQAPLPVLFTGESGTGKSAFALALHQSSARRAGPFVELNCAAIPETLFESELFGAERGAHSTATKRIAGKIEAAQGGTLFFDEIAEIPLPAQSKLLTFLQSRRYYRLGSTTPLDADVRIAAATNADLEDLVRTKRFREDLFYRLNVLQVKVPPLRERREDIADIAEVVLERLGPMKLSYAARVALAEADWPGNVRQLENTIQRGWAMAKAEEATVLEPRHLFGDSPTAAATPDDAESYEDAMRRFQREFVRAALTRHGWNVSETARRVGIARSHLNELIRLHGLVREAH